MPGIFAYAAAINPAIVTGGTNGPAMDRGHTASLPAAHAPANNLPPACKVEPVTRRGESQAVRRVFS
jgi:hypothetical protein